LEAHAPRRRTGIGFVDFHGNEKAITNGIGKWCNLHKCGHISTMAVRSEREKWIRAVLYKAGRKAAGTVTLSGNNQRIDDTSLH